MLNEVVRDGNNLTIRSYPTLLGLFCIAFIGVAIYWAIAKSARVVDVGICLSCISVFFCLLDRRVAVFSKDVGTLTLTTTRPFGRTEQVFKLAEIEKVSVNTGRGGGSHAGVVSVTVGTTDHTIVSMASMGRHRLSETRNLVSDFLSTQ